MKQFCQTHHYFYESVNCPFCEKERFDRLSRRLVKVENSQSREISKDDIEKLKNKFNLR